LLDTLKLNATKDKIVGFALLTDKNTFAINFYQKYGFNSHDENKFMSLEFRK